jgi:hypothetical protein
MKLTTKMLKQIIKEEIENVMREMDDMPMDSPEDEEMCDDPNDPDGAGMIPCWELDGQYQRSTGAVKPSEHEMSGGDPKPSGPVRRTKLNPQAAHTKKTMGRLRRSR